MITKRWLTAAIAATALALSACGGGGGGGIGGTGTGGGDGVAYGTITGFGSVWVNGVEYSSSGTVIKRDDNTVSQSDLRIGMIARVDGSIAARQAQSISVDSAIKGRVEQIVDANRMRVMGQTVQTDTATVFENGIRPTVGDYVEVHGLPVADGVVDAGFVERKSALADPPFVVTGFVRNHDTAAQTFTIGGLTVRYVGAVFNDMPAGGWNGLLAEVKGTACAASPVCGTLTASKVEPGGLQVASAAAAEIEGFVTAISAGGFTLGAQPVVVTASTRFENGVAGDLIVGAKLEAEGSISGGILTATKVSFRDNVRLEGDIASIVGNALTLAGLPGLTVDVTSLTELDGVTSVSALGVGNHLRIRGRAGAANRVTATELERRSTAPDSRVELRGPVASISNPTLTILGVVIDSSTVAESEFKDRADAPIGRAAFFAALRVGDPVKGRGDLVGGVVRWSELELED